MQANAARSSSHPKQNPYTCPSCRASVRETRPNATVTTLLEMWLKANPGSDRNDAEKAELNEKYRPGENVTPPIRQEREREHRRRRRRHGESGEPERDSSEEDRRQMEEAVARSLRETRLSPEDANRSSQNRSRSRSRSAEAREERHARRRREEERRRRHAQGAGSSTTNAEPSAAVPTTTQVGQADSNQRDRHVEHQASLRSLMSASDGSMGEMEAEILRQIVDEGLLEGINLDDLNGAQEDELSERIADAYRRRHIEQHGETNSAQGRPTPASRDSRDRATERSTHSPRHASGERRHHSRSRSANTQDSSNESRRAPDRLPPLSRPHLLEATDAVAPPTSTTTRRRRASDHSRRRTSPIPSTQRTSSEEVVRSQAARSATDLSSSERPSTSDAAGRDRRPRHLSETRRTATDAGHEPRISELWRHGLAREDRNHITQSGSTESPQHLSPTSEHPPNSAVPVIATDPRTRHEHSRSSSSHVRLPGTPPTGTLATTSPPQLRSVPTSIKTVVYTEPSVSCFRCQKPSIEHSLHRHCSKCDISLCLRCYRSRRGCNHWFGFGPSAILRWEASAPRVSSSTMERPHALTARKWLPPPPDTIQSPPSQKISQVQVQSTTSISVLSTSDPSTRFQSGLFCDRCEKYADSCYWSCSACNDGEWGFCNTCVNTHHVCTHPLLPLANRASHPNPSSSSLHPPPPHLPNYVALRFITRCDICRKSILPSESRYHCPFHPPSGDYDICAPCYNRLVKSGKVRAEDGPSGWRRCPNGAGSGGAARGHRMIIVGFEDDARRIIMQDLVGGWRLRDDDEAAALSSNDTTDTFNPSSSDPVGSRSGIFTWREPSAPHSPITKTATSASITSKSFPPSGGFGAHCVALYSYIPDPDDPTTADELGFPRGAEITEAEDVNGDWWWGVYLGRGGVWPGGYARVIT